MRDAYERRDKSLDDSDAPVMPPERWANAVIGKYYRPIKPIKTPVTARIDAEVLEWLKSKGEGHLTRINTILREAMERDRG